MLEASIDVVDVVDEQLVNHHLRDGDVPERNGVAGTALVTLGTVYNVKFIIHARDG